MTHSVCTLGILLILTGAGEFNPQHSKTAKERPSDNVELNEVTELFHVLHGSQFLEGGRE